MMLRQALIEEAFLKVHPEWQALLTAALAEMDPEYLHALSTSEGWLPGPKNLFAAFSLPLSQMQYLLLGESPYPRIQSANGYAFWDASVESLWAEAGLSKAVNRATSLRNLIKMLLHARGDLQEDFSQAAIARLDKSAYVQTLGDLFQGLLQHGFLLLNATLVYEQGKVAYHAKCWRPFMMTLLDLLSKIKPALTLILFGKIAQQLSSRALFTCLEAEHPYQLSFMKNPQVLDFFQPLHLLDYDAIKR